MTFPGSKTHAVDSAGEIRLIGLPVARGIATGPIIPLHGQRRQYLRITVGESSVEQEINKLDRAFKASVAQLARLLRGVQASRAKADIISAHIAIIEDASFKSRIDHLIRSEYVNAEWAVSSIGDEYISKFKSIPDEHMRERYVDIQDVVDRILGSFAKSSGSLRNIPKGAVIAANELSPSTLVDLGHGHLAGCLTEHGGWTSHTFILARELGLPAVSGIRNLLRLVSSGQNVIVDGNRGEAILSPRSKTLDEYSQGKPGSTALRSVVRVNQRLDLKTIDGRRIEILLNADTPESVEEAKAFGVVGIGLFRSEMLLNRFNGFPTERQQLITYKKLSEAAGEGKFRIRTFDVGIKQMDAGFGVREKNPALGRRGIRLALEDKIQLLIQLRSILLAAHSKKIDVILPMVTGIPEITEVKAILHGIEQELKDEGKPFGKIGLGAMVEVPSAVMVIEEILAEVDFVCLGTNDLVQYLLAVDRDNESVSGWFRTLHPAVIRSIDRVLEAGRTAGKSIVICGEMAGSPFYTPLLVGLGAKEFSMNLNSIERVMRVVEGIAYEEVADFAILIKGMKTSIEIEEFSVSEIQKKWLHLFPSEFLSARKI